MNLTEHPVCFGNQILLGTFHKPPSSPVVFFFFVSHCPSPLSSRFPYQDARRRSNGDRGEEGGARAIGCLASPSVTKSWQRHDILFSPFLFHRFFFFLVCPRPQDEDERCRKTNPISPSKFSSFSSAGVKSRQKESRKV